jgi:hypothetical protein
VIGVARLFGWRVAHFRTAQSQKGHWLTPVGGDGKGFPDLCLVRERIVFIELKIHGRPLKQEQIVWRDWILGAGSEWYLITDRDWAAGMVERILQHPHTTIRSVKMEGMHDGRDSRAPEPSAAPRPPLRGMAALRPEE